MNILLTSIGTATSVGVIKNIRKYRKEWKIVGVDINEYGYTAGSQLVDKFYQVPLAIDVNYQDAIMKIVSEESIDYFWPINDQEIRAASEWGEMSCSKMLPDSKVITLVSDKLQCTKELMELGIDCPSIVDQRYRGKCIIRDRVGVGSKGIKISEDIQNEYIGKDVFVQEYITGTEYTVDVLCNQSGEPLYIIPRSRLEIKSGVSTKARIEQIQVLVEIVEKIVKKIKLPGFSNIQFIRSNDSGTYFFVEINPRIGGYSSASFLAAPKMFADFLEIIESTEGTSMQACKVKLNQDVSWNSVVTRYYEEMLYENSM